VDQQNKKVQLLKTYIKYRPYLAKPNKSRPKANDDHYFKDLPDVA